METIFKNAVHPFSKYMNPKKVTNFILLFFIVSALAIIMAHGCWAADLLKAGDTTVKDTFGQDSSLMTWLLIGEVVTATLSYVATKNIKVLFGVILISVFINIAFAIILA